jgi:hypothetical protein
MCSHEAAATTPHTMSRQLLPAHPVYAAMWASYTHIHRETNNHKLQTADSSCWEVMVQTHDSA